MNPEERFDDYVNMLEHAEAEEIGLYLVRIAIFPSGDKRMLSYLEAYLDDSRPTRVYIEPIHYAEIRYAAGKALADERAVQGVDEAVRVPASVIPLTSGEIFERCIEIIVQHMLQTVEGSRVFLLVFDQRINVAGTVFLSKGCDHTTHNNNKNHS